MAQLQSFRRLSGMQRCCARVNRFPVPISTASRSPKVASAFTQGPYQKMMKKAEERFTKETQKRFGVILGQPESDSPLRVPSRPSAHYYRSLDAKKREQLAQLLLGAIRDAVSGRELEEKAETVVGSVNITTVDLDVGFQRLRIDWVPKRSQSAAAEQRLQRRLAAVGPELRNLLREDQGLGYIPPILFRRDVSGADLDVINRKLWEADYPEDYRPSVTMLPPEYVSDTIFSVEVMGRYDPHTRDSATVTREEDRCGSDWQTQLQPAPPPPASRAVLGLQRDVLLRRLRTLSQTRTLRSPEFNKSAVTLLQKSRRPTSHQTDLDEL